MKTAFLKLEFSSQHVVNCLQLTPIQKFKRECTHPCRITQNSAKLSIIAYTYTYTHRSLVFSRFCSKRLVPWISKENCQQTSTSTTKHRSVPPTNGLYYFIVYICVYHICINMVSDSGYYYGNIWILSCLNDDVKWFKKMQV